MRPIALALVAMAAVSGYASEVDGWSPAAPRDEIRPAFAYDSRGGRSGKGAFTITADERQGLDGYWSKSFPVEGGAHYRFTAYRKLSDVPWPQQSAVV